MRKDKRFLFEDHVRLAEQLYQMRLLVSGYILKLSRAYPKTSRQVKRAWKIQTAIDSLRSEMDNVFYRDYPEAQFRKPHYEWVHTPYFNPESEKRIEGNIPELNDE